MESQAVGTVATFSSARSSEWLTFIIQRSEPAGSDPGTRAQEVSPDRSLPLQGTAECKAFFDTAASILKRKGSGPGSGENKASERRAVSAGRGRTAPLFPQPEPARPTAAARAGVGRGGNAEGGRAAGTEQGQGAGPAAKGEQERGGNAGKVAPHGRARAGLGRGRRAGSGRGAEGPRRLDEQGRGRGRPEPRGVR